MLKGSSAFQIFLWNLLVVAVWHMCSFIICVKLPVSHFSYTQKRFQAKKWEQNGHWYKKHLKIHLWKDKMPQHVGKGGFSKTHFTDVSIEYLDKFIMETCRGEWNHSTSCGCIIIILFSNPLGWGLLYSSLVLLGNLPFVAIQRYNRFRLLSLRKKILRGMAKVASREESVNCVVTA